MQVLEKMLVRTIQSVQLDTQIRYTRKQKNIFPGTRNVLLLKINGMFYSLR